MIDSIFEELNQLPPNELEEMFKLLTNQMSYIENHPKVLYSYKHPDYKERARPGAAYLQTLELLGWDYEVPDTYIRDLLSRPSEQLANDLESFIINELVNYHRQCEDGKPSRQIKFIVALLLLKEIRAEKNLDIVLELLRQDNVFFETYFDNSGCDIFPIVLYHIASNQLPKLLNFMKEPGLLPFGKAYAFTAVANIACTHPERRPEVISWIGQVLDFFFANLQDETVFDGIVIDSFSYDIMNIHGKEVLPQLEKLYATNRVMNFIAPDIKGIRKNINKTKTESLDDIDTGLMLQKLKEMSPPAYNDEEDDEDYSLSFEKYLEEEKTKPKKQQKNVKTPPSSQCFTLKISLQYIEPEIWRLVEVPSSLTLPQLHEVIQTVLGWEDYHLHQFNKGKTYYMSDEQLEDQMSFGSSNCIDYTDVTIGELLPRKRSKIGYEYDFGDGWKHDIILEAQRPYEADEQPRIFLIDGANACPPEDCGGYPGYMALKEAMKNKRTKAYKEYAEWLGGPFDPQAFGDDKEEINEMLEGIL